MSERSDDFWRALREIARQHEEARSKARRGRGPRSRLVDAIFVMLLAKPMRSAEIAGILGYDARYIASYLSYWKARGYVEYESGLWYLTPLGEDYAREVLERESNDRLSEFIGVAQRILGEAKRVRPAMKRKRGRPGEGGGGGSLRFIAGLTGERDNETQDRVAAARCALEALSDGLSGDEVEVLGALLDHYARWGSTYLYLDQLQEMMGADFNWLVKVLRDLQAKSLVYIYKDPRLGLRVGLAKRAREALQACGASL